MTTDIAKREAAGTPVLLDDYTRTQHMLEFSKSVAGAKFITQAARGDVASVFFLVATAEELGMKWTHGLRSLYMTPDGKVGLQGDIVLALLLSRGFKVKFDSTEQGCTTTITRPDGSMTHAESFTKEDAERIKIYTKDKNGNGTWKPLADKFNYVAYGKDMYMWRSLMRCARRAAADLIGGIYLPDEIEDLPPEDTAPAEATTTDPGTEQVGGYAIGVTEEEPTQEEVLDKTSEAKPEAKPEPETKTQGSAILSKEDCTKRIGVVADKLAINPKPEVLAFFCGYFGKPDGRCLPKMNGSDGAEAYRVPLAELERLAESGQPEEVTFLRSNPTAYGERFSKRIGVEPESKPPQSATPPEQPSWSDATIAAAKALIEGGQFATAEAVDNYIRNVGVSTESDEELRTFLLIRAKSSEAHLLVGIKREYGQTFAAQLRTLLARLGVDNLSEVKGDDLSVEIRSLTTTLPKGWKKAA
jgi:hypothetical protein